MLTRQQQALLQQASPCRGCCQHSHSRRCPAASAATHEVAETCELLCCLSISLHSCPCRASVQVRVCADLGEKFDKFIGTGQPAAGKPPGLKLVVRAQALCVHLLQPCSLVVGSDRTTRRSKTTARLR